MSEEHLVIAGRLLGAILAGGLIGLERSFRGRPAGFRTHTLVCLASAVLMLIPGFTGHWIHFNDTESVTMDPTRMAQGIMTGIGFLGAGVIFKEGISVRGLTTAASIWITAALGILIGIGFYFPATVTTALVLFVLSIFHWIEARMPTQNYARLEVAFRRPAGWDETELRSELKAHGFSAAHWTYRVTESTNLLEYRMMIHTAHAQNFQKLANSLTANPLVIEFRIAPSGD